MMKITFDLTHNIGYIALQPKRDDVTTIELMGSA